VTTLITGFAGGLAQNVAERLLKKGVDVVGADYRPLVELRGTLHAVPVYRANYNKTAIEAVFKKYRIERVLHLGRVGNLSEAVDKRFDLNVIGTQKIMDLAVEHRVKRMVVLSTFHIYGAHPSNHIPIAEEEPLRSSVDFPQLGDALQLDGLASNWAYRHPTAHVCVLRPTNVIGPTISNTMSNYLRRPRVAKMVGFDPMWQFIHEEDLASAIVAASGSETSGVFNLAGDGTVPWTRAAEMADAQVIPLPSTMAQLAIRLFSAFPSYLINFFKYPCVITDRAFREAFGWAPVIPLDEALRSTVAAAREAQRRARER
jgi:UDP-glucose 4-epimerase